jgi:hypothetical protein
MTVVAGEARGIGRDARIGTMTLLAGALGRTRGQALPLMAVWLAMGVGGLLIAQLGGDVKPDAAPGVSALTLIGALKGTLNIVLEGMAAAIGLRILLQGPGRWRELDRPLLECAAIIGVMGMAFLVPSWAYGLLARFGIQLAPTSAGLVFLVVMVGGFYVAVKLVLWPIGRLMSRPELTAARSWRLTRRATRGYILAQVVLFLPIIILFGVGYAAQGPGSLDTPFVNGLLGFATAAFSVLSMGIDATLYRLRFENPATVADVFD